MQKHDCEQLRRELKFIAERLWALREEGMRTQAMPSEALANEMLAYRHLEDASMRLGKAIQALDGGVSVYDKEQVPMSLGDAPVPRPT